jgi:hypothetical protein
VNLVHNAPPLADKTQQKKKKKKGPGSLIDTENKTHQKKKKTKVRAV